MTLTLEATFGVLTNLLAWMVGKTFVFVFTAVVVLGKLKPSIAEARTPSLGVTARMITVTIVCQTFFVQQQLVALETRA